MSFRKLGLRPELLSAVESAGYKEPTPIQQQAIPIVLEGRDLMGAAQTGTGKTAGFTLPLLQRLMASDPASDQANGRNGRRQPASRPVRCLIVTPTRELAAQVNESVCTYGRNLPLKSTMIFGGVGMQPQINALKRGVDIVVATPGRLLDHAGRKTLNLSQVEILVLDEADRMLDMGFIHDIRRIIKLMPAKRQNLLFSATLDGTVRELANGFLDSPAFIQVAQPRVAADTVEQAIYRVNRGDKTNALISLIKGGDWSQVLVFTRTKHRANRLAAQIDRAGISATAIHGNKSQGARTRALKDFKANRVRVLVATDIAARGLDISGLPHVVNFEISQVPEDYVHRIGRTGRAGAGGQAVSLISSDEEKLLKGIERLLKEKLPESQLEGFKRSAVDPTPAPYQHRPGRPQGRKPGAQPGKRTGGGRSTNGHAGNKKSAAGGSGRPRRKAGPSGPGAGPGRPKRRQWRAATP